MAPRFCGRHALLVLRPLLFLALLHRLNCLAFLTAGAPVLLLTTFLLGVVLVHSDDDHRHLYKKIRHHHRVIPSSSDESSGSSSSEQMGEEDEEDHGGLAAEQEDDDDDEQEVGKAAAVAWTADDERSIESIGSLELERDARLEKLMFRRSSSSLQRRSLIDLDVHIPARNSDDIMNKERAEELPGSAPSSLLRQRDDNPLFHQRDKEKLLSSTLTRHESFTAAAPPSLDRPSRFKPYFVAADDDMEGTIVHSANSNSKKSSSSSSSTSSSAGDHQKQQQQTMVMVKQQVQEAAAAAPSPSRDWDGNRIGMAVDVELISDSSDDDMSLPGGDAAVSMTTVEVRDHSDDDEEDSFEVASITQQVAAAGHHHRQQQHEQDHHHRQQQQHEQDQQPQMAAAYASGPFPSKHQHQHQYQYQYQQEDGGTSLVAPVLKEREVSEIIKEHYALPPLPIVVDSSSSSSSSAAAAAGATGAAAEAPGATAGAPGAGAGRGAGAGASAAAAGSSSSGGKSSIKFKAPSKKAVLGFFRK